jgi:hypothetical protein
VLVLFALNRQDPLNDKTALLEVAEFERAPRDFDSRAQGTFAQLGASSVELGAAVECVARCQDLPEASYRSTSRTSRIDLCRSMGLLRFAGTHSRPAVNQRAM